MVTAKHHNLWFKMKGAFETLEIGPSPFNTLAIIKVGAVKPKMVELGSPPQQNQSTNLMNNSQPA